MERADTAKSLERLGAIARNAGRIEEALSRYAEAATAYRADDDALGEAHAVRHIADIEREIGRLDDADGHYRSALVAYDTHEENASPLDVANAVRGQALLHGMLGRMTESQAGWSKARETYARLCISAGVEECDRHLAALLRNGAIG